MSGKSNFNPFFVLNQSRNSSLKRCNNGVFCSEKSKQNSKQMLTNQRLAFTLTVLHKSTQVPLHPILRKFCFLCGLFAVKIKTYVIITEPHDELASARHTGSICTRATAYSAALSLAPLVKVLPQDTP